MLDNKGIYLTKTVLFYERSSNDLSFLIHVVLLLSSLCIFGVGAISFYEPPDLRYNQLVYFQGFWYMFHNSSYHLKIMGIKSHFIKHDSNTCRQQHLLNRTSITL